MCGIAGVRSLTGLPVSRRIIEQMVDVISHRGPDDRGVYITPDGLAAIGSRRLSIIDLSPAGRMPLSNEDGSVRVAFNGEIYNFCELRESLVRSGHVFRSHTDTEVLVHLYEEYGEKFLELLSGMFAIALLDEKRHTILLARDRCGEKPLYYTSTFGQLRFGSEIKAILCDRTVPRNIDLDALNEYLTFGSVTAPNTLFAGISKLGPGELVIIDRDSRIVRKKYCSLLPDPDKWQTIREMPMDAHIAQTRQLLERAVSDCMISDVPVGAFLSGGVDSSSIVALMARNAGHQVEAVTIRYPGHMQSDESHHALHVASLVRAKPHVIDVTERTALDAFENCVYHLDEPIADPAAINTFAGSATLRAMGLPVALVGEGADELFLGYPYYLNHARLAVLWRMKDKLPRTLLAPLFKVISTAAGVMGRGVHRDLLRRAARGEGLFLSSEPFFQDIDKRQIAGPRMAHLVDWQPSSLVTERHLVSAIQLSGDTLAQMSYAEVQMRMAETLLMRVDKLSMAHSIEVRAPFLNRDLVAYALSVPGTVRAANGQGKYLLKRAVEDLLPRETLTRRKMGFSTPVATWFRHKWGDLFENKVAQSQLFRSGLLSRGAVLELLRQHRSHTASHHIRLWNILCLIEWAERFDVSCDPAHENEPIAELVAS